MAGVVGETAGGNRADKGQVKPRLLDLLPAKVSDRILVGEDCWTWRGWHNNLGYPYLRWEGRDRPAHRIIVELLGDRTLPRNIDVDHLCRNPGCVNPEHLEAVPHRVNIKRGRAGSKTACNYGHDWTDPHNVHIRKDGRRWCAACQRERWS